MFVDVATPFHITRVSIFLHLWTP